MADYIKRKDAAKILLQRREFAENQDWPQEVDLMELLCERLDELPAADVVERKRGKWRLYSPLTDTYECDKCGYQVIDESFRTNFCPNCGARMREVDDGT